MQETTESSDDNNATKKVAIEAVVHTPSHEAPSDQPQATDLATEVLYVFLSSYIDKAYLRGSNKERNCGSCTQQCYSVQDASNPESGTRLAAPSISVNGDEEDRPQHTGISAISNCSPHTSASPPGNVQLIDKDQVMMLQTTEPKRVRPEDLNLTGSVRIF